MPSLRADHLRPHPARFSVRSALDAAALEAHDEAVAHDRDRYRDPRTGYWVFTASYLARRGACCDSGCRHCPYVGA